MPDTNNLPVLTVATTTAAVAAVTAAAGVDYQYPPQWRRPAQPLPADLLGRRLTALRGRTDLTQRALATTLGVTVDQVRHIETGRATPTPDLIRRWVQVTGRGHPAWEAAEIATDLTHLIPPAGEPVRQPLLPLYVHPDGTTAACLIGVVLHEHGVPLTALAEREGRPAWEVIAETTRTAAPVRAALAAAQSVQDSGQPWGAAREAYTQTLDRAVRDLARGLTTVQLGVLRVTHTTAGPVRTTAYSTGPGLVNGAGAAWLERHGLVTLRSEPKQPGRLVDGTDLGQVVLTCAETINPAGRHRRRP